MAPFFLKQRSTSRRSWLSVLIIVFGRNNESKFLHGISSHMENVWKLNDRENAKYYEKARRQWENAHSIALLTGFRCFAAWKKKEDIGSKPTTNGAPHAWPLFGISLCGKKKRNEQKKKKRTKRVLLRTWVFFFFYTFRSFIDLWFIFSLRQSFVETKLFKRKDSKRELRREKENEKFEDTQKREKEDILWLRLLVNNSCTPFQQEKQRWLQGILRKYTDTRIWMNTQEESISTRRRNHRDKTWTNVNFFGQFFSTALIERQKRKKEKRKD